VLTIKGGNQLASEKVFEGNNTGFRKTEGVFNGLGDGNRGRFVNHTAQHGRNFDLQSTSSFCSRLGLKFAALCMIMSA
jgi:hypothetical protein